MGRSEILQSIESKEEQISTLKLQLEKSRHEESSTLAKIHDLESSLMRNVDDLKKSSTENTELKNQLDELQEKIKSTIKEKEDIRTSFQTTLEQIESDCIQAKEEKENMLESQLKASEDKGILMSEEINDITTKTSTNHKDSMTAQFTITELEDKLNGLIQQNNVLEQTISAKDASKMEIQKELSEEVQKREKLETLLQLSHEQLDSTRSKTNLERS